MTKNDLINEVMYEMSYDLSKEQLEKLKITFLVKMHDYDVAEMKMLPVTSELHDNEWLLKRYLIDSIASDRKKSTTKAYIDAMRTFFRETGKNYSEVTSQDITDYLAIKQHRDGISQNYKATLYRYFSTFFKWAYRNEHIDTDVMKKVANVRSIQKKKERFTEYEIEDLREACDTDRETALIELLFSTGMRVGEVSLLNIKDVDLQNRRVNIFGIKTNTYRTGMLSTKAVKALKRYIDSRTDKSEALFVADKKPHNRLGTSSIESIVKEVGRKAGIARIPVTVHVFRKTFASVLYRKTKDVLMVSKLLGHSNTDMTVRYYLIDDIEDIQYRYNMVN